MNNNLVGITVLTGYLGSGKTTLMNHILKNNKDKHIALIVNDIGEVNIDEELIKDSGYIRKEDKGDVVPLSNGCICCTLKTDLLEQLDELISSGKFDYILIEASGICEPLPIAQTIAVMNDSTRMYGIPDICRLDNVVTVVDALRMSNEFNCGNDLLKENLDEDDIENLLIEQIEFCNVIVLNKVSEVSSDQLNKVKGIIKALQPNAKIIETDYCNVDIDEMIDTNNFNLEEASMSAGWIEAFENPEEHEDGEALEYGIDTFVYTSRKPMDLDSFKSIIDKHDKSIIRSKGYLYLTENNDNCYVFEKSGKQKVLTEVDKWLAAMDEETKNAILAENPDIQEIWDEEIGDRMTKLVFIGKDMDKDSIIADLKSCER